MFESSMGTIVVKQCAESGKVFVNKIAHNNACIKTSSPVWLCLHYTYSQNMCTCKHSIGSAHGQARAGCSFYRSLGITRLCYNIIIHSSDIAFARMLQTHALHTTNLAWGGDPARTGYCVFRPPVFAAATGCHRSDSCCQAHVHRLPSSSLPRHVRIHSLSTLSYSVRRCITLS